jgi:hypothetical protein
VAREHGVSCDDPVPLAGASNVLVHLRPAPIVVRVMTATAALHDDVERWLEREIAVASFAGDLVVPPSDLLPPGPYERDGFWMTMWKFVAHDAQAPPPEPGELGRSLRRLHEALAGYRGDLAPLSDIRDWLAGLLDGLQDADELRLRLDALTPTVFESPLPGQAIHGDASMSNLLRTASGLVWNDLEDVCTGPVAWDVAGLVHRRDAAFKEEFLAAYGDPGVEELEPFLEAHALYEVIWRHARAG